MSQEDSTNAIARQLASKPTSADSVDKNLSKEASETPLQKQCRSLLEENAFLKAQNAALIAELEEVLNNSTQEKHAPTAASTATYST